MPKVFTTVPGLELRIGNYGTATMEIPVDVPDEVAAELKKDSRLRIVLEVDGQKVAKTVEKAAGAKLSPRRGSPPCGETKGKE